MSLDALNAAFLGLPQRPWPEMVAPLVRLGVLAEGVLDTVTVLVWFVALIGNTDMHWANLSFQPASDRFALAPAYDMLPMGYAPFAGRELVPFTPFNLRLPLPDERDSWQAAAGAALASWRSYSCDVRASRAMRAQAAAKAGTLERAMRVLG